MECPGFLQNVQVVVRVHSVFPGLLVVGDSLATAVAALILSPTGEGTKG